MTPVAAARRSVQYAARPRRRSSSRPISPPAVQVVNSTQLPLDQHPGEATSRFARKSRRSCGISRSSRSTPTAAKAHPTPCPMTPWRRCRPCCKRFIKSLPNGRYRIYLVEGVEGGEQTTRLIREFYKSGKSLGDPVHEIGPGSIEGQEPEAPAGGAKPAPAANGHTDGKTSQGSSGDARASIIFSRGRYIARRGSAAMRRPLKPERQRVIGSSKSIGPWKAAAGGRIRRAARVARRLRGRNKWRRG